jgi:hypothetical protein
MRRQSYRSANSWHWPVRSQRPTILPGPGCKHICRSSRRRSPIYGEVRHGFSRREVVVSECAVACGGAPPCHTVLEWRTRKSSGVAKDLGLVSGDCGIEEAVTYAGQRFRHLPEPPRRGGPVPAPPESPTRCSPPSPRPNGPPGQACLLPSIAPCRRLSGWRGSLPAPLL